MAPSGLVREKDGFCAQAFFSLYIKRRSFERRVGGSGRRFFRLSQISIALDFSITMPFPLDDIDWNMQPRLE